MLPQSHIIIARQIYKHIDKKLNIQLDKNSLIYGSIKPDIPFHSPGVAHFKPESFDYISNKIYDLSLQPLSNNTEFIKYISRNIGIVTHYIADYFCVPHNDREKYKKQIINHFNYESNLHKEYKSHLDKVNISKNLFNLDNHNLHSIKSLIDDLHKIYMSKDASFKNDIISSIEAAVTTGLLIVYNSKNSKSSIQYNMAA